MKVPVSQMKSRLMCRGGTHEVHDDVFQDHACYSCMVIHVLSLPVLILTLNYTLYVAIYTAIKFSVRMH